MAKGQHARLNADFLATGPEETKQLTYAAHEMTSAANVLERDREPVSALFLDALEGAGDLLVAIADWRGAEEAFGRALEYLARCRMRVEDGEQVLVRALRGDETELPPEVAILTDAERRQVLEGFRVDYRILLQRTSRVGVTLGRVSAERHAQAERRKLLSGWQARTHGIMQHLRVLRETRLQDSDLEAVGNIDLIEEAIGDLTEQVSLEDLYLAESVRQELKLGMVWHDFARFAVVEVEESWPPVRVNSARAILRAICETAVGNAVEAGVRTGADSVRITIGTRATRDVGWLGFTDDAGSPGDLTAAVAAVNQALRPSSSRGEDGGTGLLAARTMLVDHLDLRHAWGGRIVWNFLEDHMDSGWPHITGPIDYTSAILVIGSANTGKSRFFEACLAGESPKLYWATLPSEPRHRDLIQTHRARRGPEWITLEAAQDPVEDLLTLRFLSTRYPLKWIFVDGLTTWIWRLGGRPRTAGARIVRAIASAAAWTEVNWMFLDVPGTPEEQGPELWRSAIDLHIALERVFPALEVWSWRPQHGGSLEDPLG